MQEYLIRYSDILFNRTHNSDQTVKAEALLIDEGGNLMFFKSGSDSPFVAYAAGSWLSVEAEESENA